MNGKFTGFEPPDDWVGTPQARSTTADDDAKAIEAAQDHELEGEDQPEPRPQGTWRPVASGEIFPPGRTIRINVATGQTEVLEPADRVVVEPDGTPAAERPPVAAKATVLAPNPDGVPLYLTRLPRWLLWRIERRVNRATGEITATKPPISFHTGKKCDAHDPRNWTDFTKVAAALTKSTAWDGFGIALGEVAELGEILIGLDLDACLDDDGALAHWAMPFLVAIGSYAEESPGGGGIKCIARIRRADLATVRKLLGIPEGDREQARTRIFGARSNGAHAPGVQLFLGKRYFTITGRHWTPSPEDVTLISPGQLAPLGVLFRTDEPPDPAPSGEPEPDEAALRDKFGAASGRNPRLGERWEGGTAGLNDTSRSGFDMSIVGMLITAGFSKSETRAALRLFEHGKLPEEEAAGRGDRYFSRMWERSEAEPPEPTQPEPDPDNDPYEGLAETLSARSWLQRTATEVTRLLGDLITTTTRAFIVGRTGLGKTILGLAFAVGMACGTGFLHWRSSRPARVIYVDGEMPADLLIQRIADAAERIDRPDLIENLMVFSLEDAEAIADRWPALGMFEPLNTEAGQDFIKRLCTALRPDVIIFDNVQALLAGVQKEEETWIPVLPLVQWLTKQHIGQLWIDHTGHNADRQYGTAVKAWRFDVVGVLAPLPEGERDPHETAFTLSFDHPGKARRRTPENWAEFASHIIRLREGKWTGEPVDSEAATRKRLRGKVKPSVQLFHDALLSAIAAAATGRGQTAMFAWETECIRKGLLDPVESGDDATIRARKRAKFRTAKSDLLAARMIGINGERVSDLTQRY